MIPFYLMDVFTTEHFAGNPLAVVSDAAAQARFFGPNVGIAEDPATGSAAGPLAVYLVTHELASERRPVIVEQGRAMGRPSRIEVRVRGGGVRVSGSAVLVVEGRRRR
jgi:PhzF family phenazine biosynthesis protein